MPDAVSQNNTYALDTELYLQGVLDVSSSAVLVDLAGLITIRSLLQNIYHHLQSLGTVMATVSYDLKMS